MQIILYSGLLSQRHCTAHPLAVHAHDSKDVALWHSILQKCEHAVLDDVIEAGAEATARNYCGGYIRRVEIDVLARPCA